MEKAAAFIQKRLHFLLNRQIFRHFAQMPALFAITLDIAVDAFFNNIHRFCLALHVINDRFLVLEVLVNGEKVLHLVKDVLRQLGDVVDIVVGRVIHRHADYLLVVCAIVEHLYHAYRVALHQRH